MNDVALWARCVIRNKSKQRYMFHSFRFLEGSISNFEGNPTMMLLTVNFLKFILLLSSLSPVKRIELPSVMNVPRATTLVD